MPYKKFVIAYKSGSLGYLVRIPQAACILLNHKARDCRLHSFLGKWLGALLVVPFVATYGLNLMPMFLAAGVFALCLGFFAFLVWLSAGDIFLKFALKDKRLYELAMESQVLSVFENIDSSLP